MSSDWLVLCLAHISDDLVEEAMVSRRTGFHFPKLMVGIAACISVVLLISLTTLIGKFNEQVPAAPEPFTPMTLSEIASSKYADFIPELEGNGYILDVAGIYGHASFKASFFSESSEVHILIEPYSDTYHNQNIIDMSSLAQSSESVDPIFLAEQFDIECVEYVTSQVTAAGRIITQFSVLKDGYVAQYVIKSTVQDDIAQAIERICLCYK